MNEICTQFPGYAMSAALKLFAVEFDGGSRSFSLAERELGDGHVYQGPELFRSWDSAVEGAQAEDDSDEFSVTPVTLHANGQMIDGFGTQINRFISMQTGQSALAVVADVKAMHAFETARLRKGLAGELSGLGG